MMTFLTTGGPSVQDEFQQPVCCVERDQPLLMSLQRGLQVPAAAHQLLFGLLLRPLAERHGAIHHHVPHKALDPVHRLHAQPDRVRHPVHLHAALPHLLLRRCQRLALRRAHLQNHTLSLLRQPLWWAVRIVNYCCFIMLTA